MRSICLMIAAGLLWASPTYSIGGAIYRAVDLGLLNGSNETIGFDLNGWNLAIGFSDDNVYWTTRTHTRHMPDPTPASSSMFVVNNAGTMAGLVFTKLQRRAVLVTADGRHDFFLDGTWAADSLDDSPIRDISNRGEVLGVSVSPWLWSETNGLRALGVSARDATINRLNDKGNVVGSRFGYGCASQRAFVYESLQDKFTPVDGGPDDLDKPVCGSYSEATALNNTGQVVGYSNLGIGGADNAQGFRWSRETGFVQISSQDPRVVQIMPLDINDKGQVIGTFRYSDSPLGRPHSFFYWDEDSGLVDLQSLLDPQDGMTSDAVLQSNDWKTARINDKGTILVSGKLRSAPPPRLKPSNRTFVLLPKAK